MERIIKVRQNQSLLDVILQTGGTMESGILIASENGWPISYLPPVGTNVAVHGHDTDNADVLKYLTLNNIVIGTKGFAINRLITEDTEETIISEDGTEVFDQEE